MKKNTKLNVHVKGFELLRMIARNTILVLLFLTFSTNLFSQSKTVEKANLAYQYKQYAKAASLYETAISEKRKKGAASKNTLNLKTKLAFCYRMNNKLDIAEALYAEIVQDERAKSKTYLFYGETLMSNGKYEEAKQWFLDYQILEPDDKRGALMAANCDKVQLIEPYFQYIEIKEYPFNSDADDNAPVAWQDGIVFSSDRKQGVRLMKEKSEWTGRDYLDLYFSSMQEDSTFGEPRKFSAKLSEVNKNTGNASFSSDGSEVYFTRNDNVLNKRKTYNLQLFRSIDNGTGRWKKAEKLSFCSPNYNYMHPAISPDGQVLFFATNLKGEGGTDLWVSKRKGDDWGKPENLGLQVNTSANEGFPFMDENGKLYFCSKGHPGYGGFDIFFTEMDEGGNWATPQNLGRPINSPLDDISIFINKNEEHGMFTSSRNGGDDDIYIFEVLGEAPANRQFTGLIPRSDNNAGPFINEKPTAVTEEKKTEQPEILEVVLMKPAEEHSTGSSITGDLQSDQPNVKPVEEETVEVVIDPFSAVPVEPIKAETNSEEQKSAAPSPSIFFEIPSEQTPAIMEQPTVANYLFSFQDFIERAYSSDIQTGQVYRIDGATFDANIWQLTPRISKKLDELVAVMRRFPAIQVELSSHTETPGLESHNLELSKNRIHMAVEYMVKEGISAERMTGIGYGETMPLNHCLDGVNCSPEDHLYNQRFEVRVLTGIEN